MSTHNLCFGANIRKIGIPLHIPVFLYKVGLKGVVIARTCVRLNFKGVVIARTCVRFKGVVIARTCFPNARVMRV